jgi:hypothetical protein
VKTSLELQLAYHSKQREVINLKEARISKLTKNLQNLQLRMETQAQQEKDSLQVSFYYTLLKRLAAFTLIMKVKESYVLKLTTIGLNNHT